MKLRGIKLTLGALLGLACVADSYALTVVSIDTVGTVYTINGSPSSALFSGTDFGATGTGVIDPFLRIQANRSEQGMNTSLVGNYLDNKMPLDGYTRDLPLANLGTVSYNGNNYYEFFLDVNQVMNNNNPDGLISLLDLKIWISDQQTTAAQLDALRGTAGNVWDMNDDYDVQIKAGNGSGNGDLTVLVPVPANPSALGSYVYLYSSFGYPGGRPSDDGFEEWRSFNGTPLPGVPDGGTTAMLLGAALSGMALLRKRLA